MGAEFLVGASASLAANESSHVLHQEQEELNTLRQIHTTLKNIEGFFAAQPANKSDEHKTLNLFNSLSVPMRYALHQSLPSFLTLHLLVPVAATLNVSVSGVPTFQLVFATAPTAGQFPVGQYVRWRYPDGTLLNLQTPAQSGAFPIELLYSDELGD